MAYSTWLGLYRPRVLSRNFHGNLTEFLRIMTQYLALIINVLGQSSACCLY